MEFIITHWGLSNHRLQVPTPYRVTGQGTSGLMLDLAVSEVACASPLRNKVQLVAQSTDTLRHATLFAHAPSIAVVFAGPAHTAAQVSARTPGVLVTGLAKPIGLDFLDQGMAEVGGYVDAYPGHGVFWFRSNGVTVLYDVGQLAPGIIIFSIVEVPLVLLQAHGEVLDKIL